jgi:hypothetical protein
MNTFYLTISDIQRFVSQFWQRMLTKYGRFDQPQQPQIASSSSCTNIALENRPTTMVSSSPTKPMMMRIALFLCWVTFTHCNSQLSSVRGSFIESELSGIDGISRRLQGVTLRGFKSATKETMQIVYPSAQKGSKKGSNGGDFTYGLKNSKKGKGGKKEKRSKCEYSLRPFEQEVYKNLTQYLPLISLQQRKRRRSAKNSKNRSILRNTLRNMITHIHQ